MPFAVIENTITLTKCEEIVIEFKKYFINISSTIQSVIKFSKKKFHSFLPDIEFNYFFKKLVDKTEIQNILCLTPVKGADPNSIPTKILKLLSNNTSNQLSDFLIFHFCLVFSHQS